jgi:antitoxin HicB
MSNNKHVGSSVDDFLKEDGIFDEARSVAIKRVIAWQIQQAMKQKKISKRQMAERMKTSRTQIDRLLDPANMSVQLNTLQRAAGIVGQRLIIELEPEPYQSNLE